VKVLTIKQAEFVLASLGTSDKDTKRILKKWQRNGYVYVEKVLSDLDKLKQYLMSALSHDKYKQVEFFLDDVIKGERQRAGMAVIDFVQENKLLWGESKKKIVKEILEKENVLKKESPLSAKFFIISSIVITSLPFF